MSILNHFCPKVVQNFEHISILQTKYKMHEGRFWNILKLSISYSCSVPALDYVSLLFLGGAVQLEQEKNFRGEGEETPS